MATTELLAIGTAAASSADITVSSDPISLLLVSSTALLQSKSLVNIEAKTAAGLYMPIGTLSTADRLLVLSAPGTYRVSRVATGASVGVDQA